ncbi:MAG TPA: hypothetical protein VE988_02450 [Gemmataceae bacterium]|nr:hypothetical protein [Gemmataceae bacterium]
MLSRRTVIGGLGAGLAAVVAARFWWPAAEEPPERGPGPVGPADLVNCVFQPAPADPFAAPELRIIPIPTFRTGGAIWGATGRDSRGHIWFGVSMGDSAHLLEYIPQSGEVLDRGDVMSELRRSGIARRGESQMKIHSKIVQADDGNLYFTSMDEQGEQVDGSRLPTWGAHLWRLRLPGNRWEHLLATPEALIAVAVSPGLIYALGYFDHVLYQYDIKTAAKRSVHIGAVGGHISRNFLADQRGHVFVPRLKRRPGAPQDMATTLVELDPSLRELDESRIGGYTQTADDDSHGIVGIQPLADGSLAFTTDRGRLYRIMPLVGMEMPALVLEQGWFHPQGEAYVGSLFTYDGARHLMGMSRRQSQNTYEWLVHDIETNRSTAVPVVMPTLGGRPLEQLLLYGSVTRDNEGNFILAGLHRRDGRDWPILLRAVRPR